MSASIYGTLQWCRLTPEEISGVIERIKDGNTYNGEDFYREIESLNGWVPAAEPDDSVLISNSDDAGPITVGGKEIGLFVHFDEDARKFDWACTYEI